MRQATSRANSQASRLARVPKPRHTHRRTHRTHSKPFSRPTRTPYCIHPLTSVDFPSSRTTPFGALMLKYIAIALVVLIAIILALAATKPDTFQVQRSASMQAQPEKILLQIDDFHNWASWSPWEKLDPDMKKTFTGSPSGKGAVYAWEGNSKVGAGRMEILETTPSSVTIQLDFLRPFPGHNLAEFTLTPQGSTTQVTWAMHGPSPFISKVMQVFMSMDALIGKDFETGLANMKAIAEK